MKKTLTAGELIQILSEYPDSVEVVLTLTERDLKEIQPFELMGEEVRELRLPGDRSYNTDDNIVAFCVWG